MEGLERYVLSRIQETIDFPDVIMGIIAVYFFHRKPRYIKRKDHSIRVTNLNIRYQDPNHITVTEIDQAIHQTSPYTLLKRIKSIPLQIEEALGFGEYAKALKLLHMQPTEKSTFTGKGLWEPMVPSPSEYRWFDHYFIINPIYAQRCNTQTMIYIAEIMKVPQWCTQK